MVHVWHRLITWEENKSEGQGPKTSQDNMHKLKTFATLIRKQLLILEHAL